MRAAITSLALAGGLALGCLVELPRGRSCGDGWWDPEYEECDPSSSDRSYMAGMKCPSGADALRCTDQCTLELLPCPTRCGDGIVDADEECDPGRACVDDDECGPNQTCYLPLSQCMPDDGYGPNLDCSHYATEAIGMDKPYTAGTVERCTEHCVFGRNECSFCGDGQRDASYDDFVQGGPATFPAEVCDGNEVQLGALEAHCGDLCPPLEPVNADVVILCAFECNAKCNGFEPGDPDAPGCCLAKDAPCPTDDIQGVPDLPCCSWLEDPELLAQQKCVGLISEQGNVKSVCP
jgi:hypothetical protein